MKPKQTILIVEDELLIRWSLRNYLQQLGLQVIEADSGEAGLEHLGRDGISAAVLDLRLPGINGIEVLRQIRQSHPHCRVWIMTAHGTPEAEQEARALGIDDFLNKPLDFRHLAERVFQAVDG